MDDRALIGLSILISLIASARVAQLFVWPRLRELSREEALNVLLAPHLFRFIGLSFLMTGVASPAMPYAFAAPAAYGDLVSAALAFVASIALSARHSSAIALVWLFNIVGLADLLHAYYDGMIGIGLPPGAMGAAVYIPTVLVPPLLVTHVMMFRLLLGAKREARNSLPAS